MGAPWGASDQARAPPRPQRRLDAWARARRRTGEVSEAASTIAHEFHVKPLTAGRPADRGSSLGALAANWIDLVDPTPDELRQATSRTGLSPEAIERILRRADADPAPLLEGHGTCVLAVLAYPVASSQAGRPEYLELDVVASPGTIVTVRKKGSSGAVAPVDGVAARVDAGAPAGAVFHAAVDDATDALLELLDTVYESIDALEGEIEHLSGADVRRRIAAVRDELLRARRVSSSTRTVARRILDGRVDVGPTELFPADVENTFVDTY